jgi:glycosyltransferase involved in cell wall biosynthesis
MKIAFDYQIFNQPYGGVSLYFSKIINGLYNLGQNPRCFAPVYCNHFLNDLNSNLIAGAYLSKYPKYSKRFISVINKSIAPILVNSWQPDIIHETYYINENLYSKNIPRVITVFDMIHELFPRSFPVNDQTAIAKIASIRRAHKIICISERTKLDLLKLVDISAEKISVVHLGIDLPTTRSHTALPNSALRPFLLFVGARTAYKNFEGLLKAIAISSKLRELDLVVVGGEAFSLQEHYLMSQLHFRKDQVRLIQANQNLLDTIYSKALALVYPSLYEGFGLPPLEAMSRGCPVVCSSAGPMREINGDAVEYFDPTNLEEMAASIEAVVYSQERSNELRGLGFQRAALYKWEKCALQTLDVYQQLF